MEEALVGNATLVIGGLELAGSFECVLGIIQVSARMNITMHILHQDDGQMLTILL